MYNFDLNFNIILLFQEFVICLWYAETLEVQKLQPKYFWWCQTICLLRPTLKPQPFKQIFSTSKGTKGRNTNRVSTPSNPAIRFFIIVTRFLHLMVPTGLSNGISTLSLLSAHQSVLLTLIIFCFVLFFQQLSIIRREI